MLRVAIVLLALLFPSVAQAEARFALLIGNQAYSTSVGTLKNPYNDIAVVGEALSKQGFEVLPPIKDAKRSAMLGGVRDLVRRLNAAGAGAIGFIYYSGHGAAEKDNNINYLIPVDASAPGTSAFWDDSLKLDDVLRLLDGARSATKFIVFDACRNELQLPTKDTSKGLVPVAEQQGMFIAYASAPGRTASDIGDKSGPYAAALAAELAHPGLDHLNLFQNVKEAVLTATGGAQQPWESNGLGRRVYLTGSPPPGVTVAPSQVSEAERTWRWVKDTESQSVLENFIKEFGSTPFGAMASARLAELKKREVAAAMPPKATSPQMPAPSSHPEPGSLAHSLACRNARGRDDCERAGCSWIATTCIAGTAMQIDPSKPALSKPAQPTMSVAPWETVTGGPNDNFTVQMPSGSRAFELIPGAYAFAVERGEASFGATMVPAYADFAIPRTNIEALMANLEERWKVEWRSKASVEFRGLPAADWIGIPLSGSPLRPGSQVRAYTVLKGSHLFTLFYIGAAGTAHSPDTERFINSLIIK